jgi:biopolymer transport protein ExbD
VELNLAAMLDMAFQLLTFFILTFKPAPIEGQIDLRLPPAQPMVQAPPRVKPIDPKPLEQFNLLPIRVRANGSGQIGELALGEGPVAGLRQLDQRLKLALGDRHSTFDRIVIEASADLQYQPLMQIMDICAHQTLADGKRLTSVSLAELPIAAGD